MNIFKNRPLALGCAVFLLSLYTLYYGKTFISVTVLAVGVLLACAVLVFNLKNELCTSRVKSLTLYLIPIILALLLSSILSLAVFQGNKKDASGLIGISDEVTVTIEGEEYETLYRNAYIGKIEEFDVRVVMLTYGQELDVGSVVKAKIIFEDLSDGKYGNGAKERYLEDGILLGADSEDVVDMEESKRSIRIVFNSINKSFSKRIESITDENTASLISAVFLGDKSGLSANTKRDFARLGISHILALSGMHLSIIAFMTSGLLMGVRLYKKWRCGLTLVVILGFICLTGFSLSVLRAGLMLTVFYIMFFFRQRADFITEIFVAVSIICIISPYSVFSLSLLLSFFAMLGCALSSFVIAKIGRIKKLKSLKKFDRLKVLKFLVASIISTVMICIVTLPVVFYNFNFVSLMSPIANLIFIPLFTVVMYISPALLVLGKIPLVGSLLAWICKLVISFITYLARNMSLVRGIAVPFDSKLHPYAVILIFISIVVFMVISKRKSYIPITSLIVGCCIFIVGSVYTTAHLSKNNFVFTCAEDGGDVTYVRSDGKISIVDVSSSTRSVIDGIYEETIALGYCEIENYILSDYSQYAPSALDYLSGNIIVRKLYLSDPVDEKEQELYDEICERVMKNGVTVYPLPDLVVVGELDLLIGPEDFLPKSVKRIVTFSIEGETSRYTYLGASAFEGISSGDFAERYVQSSDAVYFGSYGPKYSVPFSFDISNVDYCIISPSAKDYFNCDSEGVQTEDPGKVFILD